MRAIIQPGKISGSITAPASKSMTQRAYAAALLHNGKTIIHFAGNSEDEKAALGIVQALGARIISPENNTIEISSTGVQPLEPAIDCGESGLCARLFIPIAAHSPTPVTITGRGSLLARKMTGVKELLDTLGTEYVNFTGFLPITVTGNLHAAEIHIDASDGSQLLSGLLFALCYAAKEPITIYVKNLASKPYIDMTIDVLRRFGKAVANHNYTKFVIYPALFVPMETVEINIEGDWSGAANLLVAGAVAGEITVSNLQPDSSQADKAILSVLKSAGATIAIEPEVVHVKTARLSAFNFDATDCPDLFPPLAILASCCNGDSSIKGVHRLFNKESNRAESITEMLMNFDVPFSMKGDTLFITGVRKLQGTLIASFNDHRIAMAAAIGGLMAGSRVDILDAEAVNKSYPGFFNDISLCGVQCVVTD